MEQSGTGLAFQEAGIATALLQWSLVVPVNQRPYAWTDDEVQQLISDLHKSFNAGEKIYFLGMMVLTRGSKDHWEVADGQQRLATTAILVAALRDYLVELGDVQGANTYEANYLLAYEPRSKNAKPKLHLSDVDHQFFEKAILPSPTNRQEYQGRHFSSHERLQACMRLAGQHLRTLTANYRTPAEKLERLYDWMDFLKDSAKVIVMMVPGYVGNSFKMFETLNARGMRASQIDILKNFLFEKGKDRISELQPRWLSMLSTIESMGDDELLVTYIRHYWISQNGPTTLDELGEKIESSVRNDRQAVDIITALDSFAFEYISLLTPREHPRWNDFSRDARNCLYTITRELGIVQIRPLLLAITRYFSVQEAEKAFEKCLSWSVRFLIVGGGGGGVLDRHYGLRAMEVSKREIATAKQLTDKMTDLVPNDEVFKLNFSTATVRLARLARYYHRAVDLHMKGTESKPQFIPNEDVAAVNIEHILPVTPSPEWSISPDVAASYHKRLGNMVLLHAKDNVKIGNKPFQEKREVFKNSPFTLTSEAANYANWGPDEIKDQQGKMAAVAPKIWPL